MQCVSQRFHSMKDLGVALGVQTFGELNNFLWLGGHLDHEVQRISARAFWNEFQHEPL